MAEPRPVVAFVGPCLAGVDPASLPAGVETRPPARRGDLLAALADRPAALVLLDGLYFDVPAVPHKELLYVLEAGVPLYGAASLGALRAAEMAPFGMVGVGEVFAAFRDGRLEGDDEVALLHLPATAGHRPTSLALVDVRWALDDLVATGVAAPAAARAVVDGLAALPFTERRRPLVRSLARRHGDDALAAALDRALAGNGERPGIKTRDALAALGRAVEDRDGAVVQPEPGASAGLVDTVFLAAWRERAVRPPRPSHPSRPSPSQSADGDDRPLPASLLGAWTLVRLLHPRAPELVRHLRRRVLLADAGELLGLEPSPAAVEGHAAALGRHLERVCGGAPFPAFEIRTEARRRLLADAAGEDPERAWNHLGAALGLVIEEAVEKDPDDAPPAPEARLLAVADAGPHAVSAWHLLRSAVCAPELGDELIPAALAAAAACDAVHRCFARWAGARRVPGREAVRLAADLWGCPPGRVPAEGARRALFDHGEGGVSEDGGGEDGASGARDAEDHDGILAGGGFAPGLYPDLAEALRQVAPAERLGRPINDYPERRRRLRAVELRLDDGASRPGI